MSDPRDSAGGNALWRVEMLGRLRAVPAAGAPTRAVERFQTQKTALLLALLALYPDLPWYREDLIARLWPDADSPTGRDRLSQALSWLRRHLEADLPAGVVIQADRHTIRLAPGSVVNDVSEFDARTAAAARAATADPARAAALLEEAIALYAGPLLPGLSDEDDRLSLERQRLEAAYDNALRRAVTYCGQAGRLNAAIDCARRLLATDPEDEEACAELMRLLARSGEPAAALRAFADFAQRRESHDDPPSAVIEALAEEIRGRREYAGPAVGGDGAPASPTAPAAVADPPPSTLPLTLTRYFGRDEEQRLLLSLLEEGDCRLITLLGPGGSGKTRLAVEVARRFAPEDAGAPDRRAYFVPLEGVSEARLIPGAVYRALQTATEERPAPGGERPASAEAVARLLSGVRRPLLVLDNCEHLAGEADVVAVLTELLTRLPALSIVATSRHRLGVGGEQCLPLSPLPAPPEQTPAADAHAASGAEDPLLRYPTVQMFVDRARRARPGFALTPENREAVAALCARLEGIPLAIELCAAWAATLAPEQMLADLRDRSDLLVTRRPDIPERHRSMRAAVETSYLRLPDDLRRVFATLSVFRGGWLPDAAEAVVAADLPPTPGATREALARLEERSLVLADAANPAAIRCRMLETLREFARDQASAAEQHAARRRHAAHFLALAEEAAPYLTGPEQRRYLDALEADHENCRAALDFRAAVAGDEAADPDIRSEAARDGLRLAVALSRFWIVRGYVAEGYSRLSRLTELLTERTPPGRERDLLEARAQSARGRLAWGMNDFPASVAAQERALALFRGVGDDEGTAMALLDLGTAAFPQGKVDECRRLLAESLEIAERTGSDGTAGRALLTLGNVAYGEQEYGEAHSCYQRCLGVARRLGNDLMAASALNNLALILRRQGDTNAAVRFFEEALSIGRALRDGSGITISLLNLAEIAQSGGDAPLARARCREALPFIREMHAPHLLAEALRLLAADAAGMDRYERAATLTGASASFRWQVASEHPDQDAATATAARAALGDDVYDAATARGRALSFDSAVDLALADGRAA